MPDTPPPTRYMMTLYPLFVCDPQPSSITVFNRTKNGMILGRNPTTAIKDKCLARVLCEVIVNPQGRMFLIMKKKYGQHHVYLNGNIVKGDVGSMVEMNDGGTLSLYEKKYPYNIKLEKCTSPETVDTDVEYANNQAMYPKANSPDDDECHVLTAARESIAQELTCSICMEIILKSTVANPCGHCFCETCIEDIMQRGEQCPNCRTAIKSTTWTRHSDSIIWAMIIKGDFELNDAEHFLLRSGKKLSEEEKKCMQRSVQRKLQEQNSWHQKRTLRRNKRPVNDNETIDPTSKEPRTCSYLPPNSVQSVGGSSIDDAICID